MNEKVFTVQVYQLGWALHDDVACPYSHRSTSKSYIPREECPRLDSIFERAFNLLEAAKGYDPILKVGDETFVQPTLPLQ